MTSFVLLVLISFIVFALLELAPGDPAKLLLGHDATEEGVIKLRAQLGLDRPFLERYFAFITKAFQGDFGRSYETRRLVVDEIRNAFPATLQLAVASLLIAVIIGIPAGITSAVHHHSAVDKTIRFFILIAVSLPTFWLGLMLILLFSITLRWFPSFGRGGLQHLVLPAVSLSCYSLAIIVRMTRSSMLEVLRNEYITTARAKGVPEFLVIYKHALRNAFIPVLTIIGLQFGILLGGAVITETIFAWPGIGRLLLQAIFSRDYPIIRVGILLISGCFVFINLIVDILYTYIDPTVGLGRKTEA